MSFSLYIISSLKRSSAIFEHPTSAVSGSCCPPNERRSFSIVRSPFGTPQSHIPVRRPEQRSLGVDSIPDIGITVGDRLSYHRNAGNAFDPTSVRGDRCQKSTRRVVKFGLRNGLRHRSAKLSKRVPSTISRSDEASVNARFTSPEREAWQTQKSALSTKFGSLGWAPRKRLSPDSLEGIRTLHAQYPDKYSTPVLAEQFKVSPEAIRRILKSKWRPNDEQEDDRRERWNKRGVNIWGQMNELGIKPPRKWRDQGVGKFEREQPTLIGPPEPSNRAGLKEVSEIDSPLKSQPTIPAVRRDVDQVPLADRIF